MTQVKLVDVITWDKRDGSKRHLLGIFMRSQWGKKKSKDAIAEIVKEVMENFSYTEAEIRSWITIETKELNRIYWEDIAGEI